MVKPNQKSAAQMQETWFAERDVLALVGTSLLESRCLRPNLLKMEGELDLPMPERSKHEMS